MRVAVHTLGCKLNYAESSTIAREFARRGYEVVPSSSEADIYVVNTCSVTEHSDKKDRNLIRRLHRRSPGALIAVVGCYAQLRGEEIAALEGVDIVLGARSKGLVVDEVERLLAAGGRGKAPQRVEICDIDSVDNIFPAYSTGERTRAFLKIQDGCDYKCSYCTVPYARGGSRSLPSALLLEQAREIAASGIVEIVLTGVNTGDYGRKTGESFLSLLRGVDCLRDQVPPAFPHPPAVGLRPDTQPDGKAVQDRGFPQEDRTDPQSYRSCIFRNRRDSGISRGDGGGFPGHV